MELLKLKKSYTNFISLGYFCEVAKDLEQLGLRNFSSPFDWVISDFRGIVSAMEQNFSGFLSPDALCQNTENRNHYCDPRYQVYFFHDFTKYKPLSEQYPAVKEKYDRRIRRFLEKIKEPTLFFRYIAAEEENGPSSELAWIEQNYQRILELLRSYNADSDIVFLGNEDLSSDVIPIFHARKDDLVSRHPILHNTELYPIVREYRIAGQEENIRRYLRKTKKRANPIRRAARYFRRICCRIFLPEYHHAKTYSIPGK